MALLLLLLLVLIATGTGLLASLTRHNPATQKQERTLRTLAQAKQALIAWAVVQGDVGTDTYHRPGTLPCPDTYSFGSTNTGSAAGSCSSGGGTSIGRLPWKSLGVAPLRDADGELLWYALSDRFRNPNLNNDAINSDTLGSLQLYAADGSTLLTRTGDELAAIIFAPGPPLSGQDRAASNNLASSFLEHAQGKNNASATGPFITGPAKNAQGEIMVNDVSIGITARELVAALEKRALKEATNALARYASAHGGKYPNPASANDTNCTASITNVATSPPSCTSNGSTCTGRLPENALAPYVAAWFTQNGWGRAMTYAVNQAQVENGDSLDCPPTLTVDGLTKYYVLLAPGTPRSEQTRPSTALSDYLEDSANADAWNSDSNFVTPNTSSGTGNDQLRTFP